jgi:hypothetical protein
MTFKSQQLKWHILNLSVFPQNTGRQKALKWNKAFPEFKILLIYFVIQELALRNPHLIIFVMESLKLWPPSPRRAAEIFINCISKKNSEPAEPMGKFTKGL